VLKLRPRRGIPPFIAGEGWGTPKMEQEQVQKESGSEPPHSKTDEYLGSILHG